MSFSALGVAFGNVAGTATKNLLDQHYSKVSISIGEAEIIASEQSVTPQTNPLQSAGYELPKTPTGNVNAQRVENSVQGAAQTCQNNQALSSMQATADDSIGQFKQAAQDFLYQVGITAQAAGVNSADAFGRFEGPASAGGLLIQAGADAVLPGAQAASGFVVAKDVVGTDENLSRDEVRARVEEAARGSLQNNTGQIGFVSEGNTIAPNPILVAVMNSGYELQEAVDYARNILNETPGTNLDFDLARAQSNNAADAIACNINVAEEYDLYAAADCEGIGSTLWETSIKFAENASVAMFPATFVGEEIKGAGLWVDLRPDLSQPPGSLGGAADTPKVIDPFASTGV